MDEWTLKTFDDSLGRCNRYLAFLDRFYEIFLASSPKVREKFANTDFVRQKSALRASLYAMLLATRDGKPGLEKHLGGLATRAAGRCSTFVPRISPRRSRISSAWRATTGSTPTSTRIS